MAPIINMIVCNLFLCFCPWSANLCPNSMTRFSNSMHLLRYRIYIVWLTHLAVTVKASNKNSNSNSSSSINSSNGNGSGVNSVAFKIRKPFCAVYGFQCTAPVITAQSNLSWPAFYAYTLHTYTLNDLHDWYCMSPMVLLLLSLPPPQYQRVVVNDKVRLPLSATTTKIKSNKPN